MKIAIIVGVCALLGLGFKQIQRNLKKINKRKATRNLAEQNINQTFNNNNRQDSYFQEQALKQQTKAALCLIVPASEVSDLINRTEIHAYRINQLIDAASYFLCTHLRNAESTQMFLNLTNEDIPTDSRRDVYIRIDIDNGLKIIDKEVRYILQRDLPANSLGIIEKLACLKNLSGLEAFNRV
jgi:hypothetical protein